MAINIILGCYAAIQFGFGPANWQTALNQVVPLTTFQDYLNAGLDWLEKKTPRVGELLNRLHVPKPIVFVDVTIMNEEVISGEVPEEPTEEFPEVSVDEASNTSENTQETNVEVSSELQEK